MNLLDLKTYSELFYINKPTLVKKRYCHTGSSDHETVLADYDIKPTINKRASCYIHQWVKRTGRNYNRKLLLLGINSYKGHLQEVFQKILLLSKSLSKPLLINIFPKDYSKSESITSLGLRQKSASSVGKNSGSLTRKAKRSHSSKDWQEYKSHEKHALQSIRRTHWNYVNSILQEDRVLGFEALLALC